MKITQIPGSLPSTPSHLIMLPAKASKKPRNTRLLPLLIQIAAALSLPAFALKAQIAAPGYSGFNRIALPGNSDSILSVPFARPEAAAGLALSFTANRIQFKGAPGWNAGQFVRGGPIADSFYVLVSSGPKEGAAYFITANDANSLTVDLEGGTLTGLASGNRLSIIPYWTLATLFPGGAGVHSSLTATNRQTEVLFPNFNAPGINAAIDRTFYLMGGSWFELNQGAAVRDDEIVYPDSYFIVRHNVAAGTEFVSAGQVVPGKLVSYLGINTASKRDNYLGLQRPTATTLADSGLISSGAFSASPTAGNRTDELLVFDNSLVRQNKAAAAVYYYWNSGWRKVGAGAASFDAAAVFQPGAGFIIRKNPMPTAPAWANASTY